MIVTDFQALRLIHVTACFSFCLPCQYLHPALCYCSVCSLCYSSAYCLLAIAYYNQLSALYCSASILPAFHICLIRDCPPCICFTCFVLYCSAAILSSHYDCTCYITALLLLVYQLLLVSVTISSHCTVLILSIANFLSASVPHLVIEP